MSVVEIVAAIRAIRISTGYVAFSLIVDLYFHPFERANVVGGQFELEIVARFFRFSESDLEFEVQVRLVAERAQVLDGIDDIAAVADGRIYRIAQTPGGRFCAFAEFHRLKQMLRPNRPSSQNFRVVMLIYPQYVTRATREIRDLLGDRVA